MSFVTKKETETSQTHKWHKLKYNGSSNNDSNDMCKIIWLHIENNDTTYGHYILLTFIFSDLSESV